MKNDIRLVSHVKPEHYEITLKPDLLAHTFWGNETITINLDKVITEITLHSKDLDITSVFVDSQNIKTEAKKIVYDKKHETATFIFPNKIAKGEIKLHIQFAGILSENMRGFYKSKYVVEGEERFMATTQFEATDARRCIPCFDEPTHKAVFKIHLITPSDKTAISNTLPESIKEHSLGYNIVSFSPTPKMSTYLLAFIIGDFEWIEKKSKNGVLVRVMTVPGKKHQADFALDVTVRCLEFYEKYFGISYPLNILDMIAIPDFSSLAMENWGAITFREIGLLVDEKNTSISTKEMVAIVIAHELAHQWFGNLVTMEWWTDLWLNEGFASYIPYLAIDELFPDWHIWDQFATDDLAIALKLDALSNTHPIEVKVNNPNEIGEIFDAVSYSKGATVIRMLADYLGKEKFRLGLSHYLKTHSYKNASTVDLWSALEKISGKPVKKMMAIWTGKMGYPVLEVSLGSKATKLTQKRYFSNSANNKKNIDKTIWPIPLSIVTPKGEKNLQLMTSKSLSIPTQKEDYFKFNAHEGSMYRVKYDEKILEKLKEPILYGKLSSSDRLGIIRDLFSFSEAGISPTTLALQNALHYKNEKEYIVWIELITGLRQISNLLAGTKIEKSFKNFAREIISTHVKNISWNPEKNEDHNISLSRPLILGAASYFGDQESIETIKKIFIERNKTPIHADLRAIVYGTIVREGGLLEYETILQMYKDEVMHEEKNRLLGALGATRDKKLLKRTLEFTMTDAVRMQDRNGAFASVLINPQGRELGWNFIKKNWKKIGEAYGDGNHLLSRLIGVLNRNTNKKAYDDIKKFFKTHTAPSADRTILQTLEYINSNRLWLARDYKKIEKYLKENKY